MNCPKCAFFNKEGAKFCIKCGQILPTVQDANTFNNSQQNFVGSNSTNQTVTKKLFESSKKAVKSIIEKTKNFIFKYKKQLTNGSNNSQQNYVGGNSTNQTVIKKLFESSKKVVKLIIEKTKNFIFKYKKQLIIISSCCLVLIISLVLFNKFYDFTKINWDKKTGNANMTYVDIESTTLTLNVLAYDKDKKRITDIKFDTENGEIVVDGTTVKWDLPKKLGKYTITATAPSGKKITKEIKVIDLDENDSSALLGLDNEKVDDKTADNDKDGLTNENEKKLGTNQNLADSDRDGINDYYENNETKTNPLKEDTDSDGINDGDELDLELDPLKSDSKDDGKKDGERDLSYTINNNKLGVELQITGKGNISSSTIDVFNNPTFSDMDGLLDKVYNFHSNGTISKATVKIKYDLAEINKKSLSEDNLTLYYFNEGTKQLEEIPTIIDKENKLIIVTLEHFSKYVIGDKSKVLINADTEIMFVIDNSVSMYSTQQMIDAGYDTSTGAVGNDTQFKRLSLTNDLVDMFTGNYKFGVAEFSGDYVNLKKISDSKSDVKKSVNSMKSNWESNKNGTNIVTALKSGIDEFKTQNNNNYLLLLTDGKNTEGSLKNNMNAIIRSAKAKNVKICVIGLGKEIDVDNLDDIAESTEGDYYSASDSSALDEIYSLVGANINYNYVDTDNDNKVDGMIRANSGFIVNKDGFSFPNFNSNKSSDGHCYGMATFAMLYYTNKLPMSLDYAHKHTFFKNFDSSDGYNLNNTYFSERGKLYDFKTIDPTLTYYLYGNPADYRDRVENDTLMIKKEYYDNLVKIGASISIKDYKQKDEKFKKYQMAIINIDNKKLKNTVKKDDSQLLSAIWRLFILQVDDDRTSFSSDPDKAFEELNSGLSEGTPLVTNVDGTHAINSIRLIQDINDSNKFKIEVYDNNFPGETRYIEVTRSKFSKWQLNFVAWTNEYEYTFKYDANGDEKKEELDIGLCYPNVNK